MKQRLLVLNGYRLVQSKQDGQWVTDNVASAGLLLPGIYNIHLGVPADRSITHVGIIVHIDHRIVYQQVGKSFVMHEVDDVESLPEPGTHCSIKYVMGSAAVVASAHI